jgi:hypothetical protein
MSDFTKPFTKPLVVRYVGEQQKRAIWEIQETFVYFIGSLDSEEYIEVPVGFQTDFATIPKVMWSVFPPTGKYTKAAVIHDYLTANKGRITIDGKVRLFSKKESDLIFLEAMGVLGVSLPIRKMMYYTVRAFGSREGYEKR